MPRSKHSFEKTYNTSKQIYLLFSQEILQEHPADVCFPAALGEGDYLMAAWRREAGAGNRAEIQGQLKCCS
jgi:hypothetical protein